MIGAAAAYMAGLFFASFFTDVVLLIIFSFLMISACIIGIHYGFKSKDIALMAVFFAASVGAFNAYTALRYRPVVAYCDSVGSFCGEVTDIRRYSGGNELYTLNGRIDGKVNSKVTYFTKSLEAQKGDVIDIGSCCFQKPKKDYLFDSERYYKSDGIFLTLTKSKDIRVERRGSRKLGNAIEHFREDMIFEFQMKLGRDSGALLAGMVFGEKHGMDTNVRTAVYRCGIGHMLAVSGLHVSVAVFALMWLLKRIRVNKYISFVLMEALLVFLSAMANYPVSAVRAAIMMNFFYAAKLFRRQNDTFNSLSAAVLLICLFQPYVVYDEGFVLSVAGTFGIGVFAPYMTKNMPKEKLYQKAAVSFAVMLCTTLCVFPLSLLFFDETSIISPITNVFIVPLCSVSMIAGLIYVITGGVVDLLFISKFINDLVLRVSDTVARSRFTHVSCESSEIIIALLLSMAVIAAVAAIFRNRRYIICTISAALIFMFVSSAVVRLQRDKNTTIAVLGSGNNAAIVVSGSRSTEIIDLSGHYRSAEYVRKYLSRNSISTVQTIALTQKEHSAFACYLEELEFVKTGKWLIYGYGVPMLTKGITYFGEAGFTIDDESFSTEYANGSVTVRSGDEKVVIMPAKSDNVYPDCLTVMYGNLPKNSELFEDSAIYLDEENNFEIMLSDSGGFKIRRL